MKNEFYNKGFSSLGIIIAVIVIILIVGGLFFHFRERPEEHVVEKVDVEDKIVEDVMEAAPEVASVIPEKPKTIPTAERKKRIEEAKHYFSLSLKEGFIEEDKREIAFLQGGDIWILSKELRRRHRIIDTEEKIVQFSVSPDGTFFWINEKGELWRGREGEPAQPLAGMPGAVEYEKYRGRIEDRSEQEVFEACKERMNDREDRRERIQKFCQEQVEFFNKLGQIQEFELSPDGKYIAYNSVEAIRNFGTIVGTHTSLWIMRNDGKERVEVERPFYFIEDEKKTRESFKKWKEIVEGAQSIRFNGWLPDSRRILFCLQHFGASVKCSPFFEIGVDGKNLKIYSGFINARTKKDVEIKNSQDVIEAFGGKTGVDVLTSVPRYSPCGQKAIYIIYASGPGNQEIRLRDVETNKVKTIRTARMGIGSPSSWMISWSKDGSLIAIRTIDELLIFNREGDLILERTLGKAVVYYPELIEMFKGHSDTPNFFSFLRNNEYLVMSFLSNRKVEVIEDRKIVRRNNLILFENLITGEKRKFILPIEHPWRWGGLVRMKFFSGKDNFYLGSTTLPAPFWIVDTNTWARYKVGDNISHIVEIP